MRKTYPYLQEAYSSNLNEEQEKRNFLALLDNFINQRQYINMTLLDWNENPVQEIDGIISSGNINKDGASAVRRTCSLSCSVDGGSYNVDSLDMLFSLNKKIFIEIGIKNETNQYSEYPILWFPQGVFYISSFSMNSSTTSAVNINLNLKDKMCLLNGEVGGTLPSTVQFDIMDTQLSTGEWVQQKVLIYEIISELVNHYGGEDLDNIIIEDVPLRIRKIVQWFGDSSLYGWMTTTPGEPEQWTFSLETPSNPEYNEYFTGMDVGYIYSDFVIPNELIGSPGDSVCTILDQIKNILGNYEYFYDEMGIFHFREIKNYLNINQSSYLLEKMQGKEIGRYLNIQGGQFALDTSSEKQYLIETTHKKSLYSFSDNHNLTSISVSPNYGNIKNDYLIEGLKKSTSSDIAYVIRYHLAIDERPQKIFFPEKVSEKDTGYYYGKFNNLIYYTDELDGLYKLAFPKLINELPEIGNFDQIYGIPATNPTSFYYWEDGYKELYWIDESVDSENVEDKRKAPKFFNEYYVKDWRTYLYIYGLAANEMGLDSGRYFAELQAFWPNEYNLDEEKQGFWGESETGNVKYYSLTTGNYYLDFIDSSDALLGEYSIQNIGCRTDVVVDEEVNCLFQPEIPDVIFLNTDDPTVNWTENTTGVLTIEQIINLYNKTLPINETEATIEEHPLINDMLLAIQKQECLDNLQPYTQVKDDVYSNLIIGGYANAAYDAIKYELFCHTNYQKVVSITALPVFYLEPNSRVELSDNSTNTYGDFMVQNITLTLGPGANLSATLNQVNERL